MLSLPTYIYTWTYGIFIHIHVYRYMDCGIYKHIHLNTYVCVCVCVCVYGFLGGTSGKEPACQHRRLRDTVLVPEWDDPLEKGMAIHSSILAWRILWTKEPGELQSTGLQSQT